MAIYLGNDKISIAHHSIYCATGTIMSDAEGIIHFPPLGFEPNLITIWNVSKRDLKEEAEANGEEWQEDYYIQYIHDGIMLMAVKVDGCWVSQSLGTDSGTIYITNASYEGGIGSGDENTSSSGVAYDEESGYSFLLSRYMGEGVAYDGISDITEREFSYAIYG